MTGVEGRERSRGLGGKGGGTESLLFEEVDRRVNLLLLCGMSGKGRLAIPPTNLLRVPIGSKVFFVRVGELVAGLISPPPNPPNPTLLRAGNLNPLFLLGGGTGGSPVGPEAEGGSGGAFGGSGGFNSPGLINLRT